MPEIITNGKLEQWILIVQDAARACSCRLDEEMESHLVFLLMRSLRDPKCINSTVATAYMDALVQMGRQRTELLRDIGDRCLLCAGFFSGIAARRNVRVDYYVDIGRSAYSEVSSLSRAQAAQMYARFAASFVRMRDVLEAASELDGRHAMTDIQASELWSRIGSDKALAQIQAKTNAHILRGSTMSN